MYIKIKSQNLKGSLNSVCPARPYWRKKQDFQERIARMDRQMEENEHEEESTQEIQEINTKHKSAATGAN